MEIFALFRDDWEVELNSLDLIILCTTNALQEGDCRLVCIHLELDCRRLKYRSAKKTSSTLKPFFGDVEIGPTVLQI